MKNRETGKALFDRDCGLLMHPTSLPNDYGAGDFGPATLQWLELLGHHGQTLWQVLPLNPCGFGNSPYQTLSAFAVNPVFISAEDLHQRGLLSRPELLSLRLPLSGSVDFASVYERKARMTSLAAARFFALDSEDALHKRYRDFLAFASGWLEDYALYATLKSLHDGGSWTDWPEPFRDRDPSALEQIAFEHRGQINRVLFEQFILREQWERVRRLAVECGVRIIGDLPIFVAHDSADVWCRPDLFRLDRKGQPEVVAGVPPDYFSKTGQLWGNPLYRWPAHEEDGFTWWRSRVREVLSWFDIVRIDHFRGFSACWEVPAAAGTAEAGRWVDAPGHALFESLAEELGYPLPFIAEDLGVITPDVLRLKDHFRLPGIRIGQFAFGNDAMKYTFLPEAYDSNCVAYTGTHDNDTVLGWFGKESGENCTMSRAEIESEREEVLAYFGTDGSQLNWDFINSLYGSEAGAAVMPLQDVLGLGTGARMNRPGSAEGNWGWRLSRSDLARLNPAMERLFVLSGKSSRGRAYRSTADRRGAPQLKHEKSKS